MDVRQARHARHVEMQHMARYYLVVDVDEILSNISLNIVSNNSTGIGDNIIYYVQH